MEAALRRAGVLRVSGLEDLLSAAETLARRLGCGRGRRRGRVAIVTNGSARPHGGGCGHRRGGCLPTLSRNRSPPWECCCRRAGWRATRSRSGRRRRPRLAEAAAMLAGLAEVDAVIALHAPAPGEAPPEAADAAARR
jgi:acetyltransferase